MLGHTHTCPTNESGRERCHETIVKFNIRFPPINFEDPELTFFVL